MTSLPPSSASPDTQASSIRILVVDDDADAAVGVKELLELEGHMVAAAHDGTSALQSAVMMNPDMALIDLRLRGEWGLDVVHSLRGQFPDIVSVIMTGESDSTTVIKALRQGVYDYLTKPFQPDQLLGVIDRAAEKIRLQEERNVMMNELALARDRAELASKSKTEFLTRLSSELGGQFNNVVKLSSVITEQQLGPVGNEGYVKCAGGISDACRRLARVMLWIGELGQLENGTMPVRRSAFALSDVIQGVVAIFESMIANKQLELRIKLAENLPQLNSDREHFSRIFGHLLSNAVKFTPAGGKIEISAIVDGFGDLRIDIADSGAGIATDQVQMALAPFSQLGNALEPDPYGVGLGLSLSERLIGLLGGRLNIGSPASGGTSIQMRFSKHDICLPDPQANQA